MQEFPPTGALEVPSAQHVSEQEQHRQAVLKARALKLAAAGTDASEEAESCEVLEFMMSHERYAVELRYLLEVAPLRELTPIPCTPDFVLGVVPIRGQIYSLLDLKKFFGLPQKGLADQNRVVVVCHAGMEVGILADEVLGTRELFLHALQTEIPGFTGIWREYMAGVTADRTIVLNVPGILGDPSIVVNQK